MRELIESIEDAIKETSGCPCSDGGTCECSESCETCECSKVNEGDGASATTISITDAEGSTNVAFQLDGQTTTYKFKGPAATFVKKLQGVLEKLSGNVRDDFAS